MDKDKYEKLLKGLSESNVGQILLTGSDKNEVLYLKVFLKEDFL